MIGFISSPVFHLDDLSGNPLAGGKVYFYKAGTSTKQLVYSDPQGKIALPSPVVLNALGNACIYGTGLYKIIACHSTDADNDISNPIWSEDYVSPCGDASSISQILGITNIKTLQNAGLYVHRHNMDKKPGETPNGTRKAFSTAERFITGTLDVYLNGVLQEIDLHYTEKANRKGYTFLFSIRDDETIQHRYLVDIG